MDKAELCREQAAELWSRASLVSPLAKDPQPTLCMRIAKGNMNFHAASTYHLLVHLPPSSVSSSTFECNPL